MVVRGVRPWRWPAVIVSVAAVVALASGVAAGQPATPTPINGNMMLAPPGQQGQDAVRRVLPDLPRGLDASLWPATGHAGLSSSKAQTAPIERDSAGRVIVYVDGSDVPALRTAVSKAGGVVTGSEGRLVRASVPGASLISLAAQPAVADIRPPERALPMSVTSEGVTASGADHWINDTGRTGAGVKIGILDIGFQGLDASQAAGELPATGSGLTVNDSNCQQPDADSHGTATAEVVHDMAPGAQLFLACIEDSVGFGQAAQWLTQQGAQIIVSGLGFLTTGRGDGTGEPGGPQDVVKQARQAGILWIAAAGNQAQLHLSGNAVDANGDGYVDLSGGAENDGFVLRAGGKATVALRWDAWPTTSQDLDVFVMSALHAPAGPTDKDIVAMSTNQQAATTGGLPPTEETPQFTNTTGSTQVYWIYVATKASYPNTSYDLTVFGDATGMQYQSSDRSVVEPASSPCAMAVGATAPNSNQIEAYSSQGPTIDGRIKPDLTGFDQVSTYVDGPTAFAGTSAAAAHVAGAAALLKGANPALDASEIEAILEHRGGQDPPNNSFGHGTLALGPPANPDAITAPAANPYTPLATPTRILDTRSTVGGHNKPLGSHETLVVAPSGIPTDATAVVVNLTGINPTYTTYLALFGSTTFGGTTSTLNIAAHRDAAAVMAVVPLGADRAFRIWNENGPIDVSVDLMGYFSPESGSTYFAESAPQRVLDTRSSIGGHPRKVTAGETVTLPVQGVAGVPPNATAVVVNFTGTGASAATNLALYGQNFTGSSTLNIDPNEDRANLAIVGIGSDGAIRIHNAGGQVNVIVDIVGWFAPGIGSRFAVLPQPVRVLDSRTGTGLRHSPLTPGEITNLQVGGLTGVPYNATGALLNATGIAPTANSFLSVWSADAPYPGLSSDNVMAGDVTANAVLPSLGSSGQVAIRNNAGTMNVLADIEGYFVP